MSRPTRVDRRRVDRRPAHTIWRASLFVGYVASVFSANSPAELAREAQLDGNVGALLGGTFAALALLGETVAALAAR
jgi:hypothetical protein